MNYLKYFKILKDKGYTPNIDVDIDISAAENIGLKLKVALSLDEIGKNSAVDFLESKVFKKNGVDRKVSEMIEGLIYSFGIDLRKENDKVTDIKTKRKEKEKKKQEPEEEEFTIKDLNEEDFKRWTTKSAYVFSDDVSKLSALKKELKIKDNEELLSSVKEFDSSFKSVGDITPKNIEDFNKFLEDKVAKKYDKEIKKGGKAV